MTSKKTALILSGGGAKGAFQCGAEKYARETIGYRWDILAGVSVGALNALMLSMNKFESLFEIWNTVTGEYVQFTGTDPELEKAVLASTVMPIVWTPVDISPRFLSMVDGGIRNISPIGDVFDLEPDEIVIINCNSENLEALPEPPGNIGKIGTRTIDLLLNELFLSDLREFVRINALVKEAAAQGFTLHIPPNGRPLKYFDYKLIQPDSPLSDVLDFSQTSIQRSLKAGMEKAKQVLGG